MKYLECINEHVIELRLRQHHEYNFTIGNIYRVWNQEGSWYYLCNDKGEYNWCAINNGPNVYNFKDVTRKIKLERILK